MRLWPNRSNPHDALFKKTFSEVEHAAAEFRAVLPAELVARLACWGVFTAAGTDDTFVVPGAYLEL